MHRALALVELGKYTDAEQDFQHALEGAADPAFRAVVLTNRSVGRLRQKQWTEAEQDLQQAIELQPGAYQGHVNLARAYQAQHKLDAAVRELDAALRQRPADAALHWTRARLQAERGDRTAERSDYEQILEPTAAAALPVVRAGAVGLRGL